MSENPNRMGRNLGGKRPKFNVFWVYGIIAAMILAWSFMGGEDSPKKTDWDTVKEFIEKGDVQKVEVINKENAQVYLKPEKIEELVKQREYKDIPRQGPQFVFTIGSLDYFQKDFETTIEAYGQNVPLSFETRRNMWTDFLGSLLPLIILIAVWIIIMRSMSRGQGGGNGGIFNVGKAKAQMFDKDSSVKITFKDVAGLEEAKVEIMEIVDFLKNPKK